MRVKYLYLLIILFSNNLYSQKDNEFEIVLETDSMIKNDTCFVKFIYHLDFVNTDTITYYLPYNITYDDNYHLELLKSTDSTYVFNCVDAVVPQKNNLKDKEVYMSLSFHGFMVGLNEHYEGCDPFIKEIRFIEIKPNKKIHVEYHCSYFINKKIFF